MYLGILHIIGYSHGPGKNVQGGGDGKNKSCVHGRFHRAVVRLGK